MGMCLIADRFILAGGQVEFCEVRHTHAEWHEPRNVCNLWTTDLCGLRVSI
ncbi:hypothetical protein RISK_000581 [Rhodopirellula islandica]|uniref:Uncharacterized protein n=1 Tax=Rhodopirellula islandica TaxID=595434 RepID=A0A0J1BM20_RHOIS|nr:hypothetical protein RISK_000581 [Rhodopirellula islandica]